MFSPTSTQPLITTAITLQQPLFLKTLYLSLFFIYLFICSCLHIYPPATVPAPTVELGHDVCVKVLRERFFSKSKEERALIVVLLFCGVESSLFLVLVAVSVCDMRACVAGIVQVLDGG